jgi:hypothetical protein
MSILALIILLTTTALIGVTIVFVPRWARLRGASERTAKHLRDLLIGAPVAATLSLVLMGLPGGVIYYLVLGPYFVLRGMFGGNIGDVPPGAMWPMALYVSLLWPWAIPIGYMLARWRFAHRPLLLRLSVVAGVEYVWLWSICYGVYRAALH